MPEVLVETAFVSLQRLDARTLLYKRSNRPYTSTAAIGEDFQAVLLKAAELGSQQLRLLVDLRAAIGRNDPEFEQAHSDQRKQLMHAFERVAVVVVSHVGKLQVTRYAAKDGGNVRIFDDLEKAMEWLSS